MFKKWIVRTITRTLPARSRRRAWLGALVAGAAAYKIARRVGSGAASYKRTESACGVTYYVLLTDDEQGPGVLLHICEGSDHGADGGGGDELDPVERDWEAEAAEGDAVIDAVWNAPPVVSWNTTAES